MSIGRKRLISKIEGVMNDSIYNNQNQIRYPITFNDNTVLKGRYILKVTEQNEGIFYSGHYKFGANNYYIYRAIEAVLDYLEDKVFLDTSDLEYDLENDDE